MLTWTFEKKIFKLKYNWKLSRNETTEKINFFVHVTDGKYTGSGEIAPNVRYHETLESVIENLSDYLQNPLQTIDHLTEISEFISHSGFSNSVKFGIESAAIHYLKNKKGITTTALLNLPSIPEKIATCYTLPVMPLENIKTFIQENDLLRFDSLKIKINQYNGEETLRAVNSICQKPLKVDANEGWNDVDAFLIFTEKIKNYNIEFIEQPFPESYVEEYKFVKKNCRYNLFADESIQNHIDYVTVSQQFHGVNIKLMKAGGYLKAVDMFIKSKEHGLKTMIGCMVESSLGISSAMNFASIADFADLDGYFILENEPFQLVKEENGQLFLNKN